MTQTSLHNVGPNLQAMPLSLIFSSRLLLTEKSSASNNGLVMATRAETLTFCAARATPVFQEMYGYSHFGINE
jgi:hypothetical protein